MPVSPVQGTGDRWIPGLIASLASALVQGSSSDTGDRE